MHINGEKLPGVYVFVCKLKIFHAQKICKVAAFKLPTFMK